MGMNLIVSLQTSDDAAEPARKLFVNDQAVDAATVQRSALLQDLLNSTTNSSCNVQLDFDAFCAWRDFDCLLNSGLEDLVSVLQTSDFLQDTATLEHAAAVLASHIRTTLRAGFTPSDLLELPIVLSTPSSAALDHVVAALAPLTPTQLYSILHRLHPFELFHLPDSLRPTAYAPFSDSACPMDFTPPLYHIDDRSSTPYANEDFVTAPVVLWALAILGSLLSRLTTPTPVRPPIASLVLSLICPGVEDNLNRLFSEPNPPTSLQLLLPYQWCPISFLPAATSLTRLHLGATKHPETSLVDALSHLSHLQDLSLCLCELRRDDSQVLCCLSPQDSRSRSTRAHSHRRQRALALMAALQHVRRVRFIPAPDCYAGLPTADSFWPPLLCLALPPLNSLEHVTLAGSLDCLGGVGKLLGGDPPSSPHRLRVLTVPTTVSACGFHNAGGRVSVASHFGVTGLCDALACVHTLRELELNCEAVSGSQLSVLSQLSLLEALELDGVSMPRDEERSFLSSLKTLRALTLRFQRDPPDALFMEPDDATAFPESGWLGLCRDAAALPLTKLCLRGELMMDKQGMEVLGGMRELRDLELGFHEWFEDVRIGDGDQAAFQAMLQGLTGLTALNVAVMCGAEAMGGVLHGLSSLRKLEMYVVQSASNWLTPWDRCRKSMSDSESEPEPQVLCKGSSWDEELRGRGGALASVLIHAQLLTEALWYMQCLGLPLGRVTAFKVDTGNVANGEVEALGSLLGCMPDLETLHLPGTGMFHDWDSESFDVLAEHIGRLTRLDELALWKLKQPLGPLWHHIRKLPLRRGFHGFMATPKECASASCASGGLL